LQGEARYDLVMRYLPKYQTPAKPSRISDYSRHRANEFRLSNSVRSTKRTKDRRSIGKITSAMSLLNTAFVGAPWEMRCVRPFRKYRK
jgi:hypothetical protein